MEGGDELLQCLEEKIASGHSMIERLKLMDKIDGIDKLIRRIQQEIKFLEKVQCMGNLKKEHLQSSNLTHLDAMVARLSCAKDPTSVMRPFKYQKSRLEIDIVCNSGASWVKVIARNAKALTLISLGNGEYGQKSILDQATSYLMCSKCHLYHYRPPDVIFNFAYGIEVPLALQLEQMGIIVEGDRIDTGDNNLNGWPPELDALCEELDNERLQVMDQRRRNQDIAKPQVMDQRRRNQDIANPQAMGIIVEGDRIDTDENNLNGWPPELDVLCEELDNERLQVMDQRRRNQDIAKPQVMDRRRRNQDIANPQAMGIIVEGDRIDTGENNLNGWPSELDALCEELDNERLQVMDQRCRNQNIAKPQVMDRRRRNQDIANPQAMGIIVEGDRIDTGENNLNGWPSELDALCEELDNERLQVMDQRRCNQDIAKSQVIDQRRRNQDIAKPQDMGIIVEEDRIDTGENNLNGWPPELDALCKELDNERLQVMDQRRRNQDIAKPQVMGQRRCNQDIAKPQVMGQRRRNQPYWWSEEIASLRREAIKCRRIYTRSHRRRDPIYTAQCLDRLRPARQALRSAIRIAKTKAWVELLAIVILIACFFYFLEVEQDELDSSKESSNNSENDSDVNLRSLNTSVLSTEVRLLNLDVSTLLAYVTNMSNGYNNFVYREPLLTQQAEMERKRPIKPILENLFQDKELVICQTAYNNFMNIIHFIGGPKETQRAQELLNKVRIVDDVTTGRIMELRLGGKIKDRSRLIFATGESMKSITVSANQGFVRAARMQDIECTVFLHEPRSLSEIKQGNATNIEQS